MAREHADAFSQWQADHGEIVTETVDGEDGVIPRLSCDMERSCTEPVTHVDQDGFAYCTSHGLERQMYQPCRKLRPHELKRLLRGEQLGSY